MAKGMPASGAAVPLHRSLGYSIIPLSVISKSSGCAGPCAGTEGQSHHPYLQGRTVWCLV